MQTASPEIRGSDRQHARWHVGGIGIDLHWRAPLELLAVEIAGAAQTHDDSPEPPPALLMLACEVLLQRLGLDDPLLAALMPIRLDLLEKLAGVVAVADQRPVQQDGKVAILRTPLTT